MKKKINYSDMPIGKLTRVKDFLPPPSELAKTEKTEKITRVKKIEQKRRIGFHPD